MASRARTLTDHEEIRRWAEERQAKPSCVRGTGGGEDSGMIRLDLPGYSGADSLEEISWDDWFGKFDESRLALLVQDETAAGEKSNFNKLIARETAEAQDRGHRSARRRSGRGSRGGSSSRARSSSRGRSSSRQRSSSRGRSRSSASTRSSSARGKRSSGSGRNRSRTSGSSRGSQSRRRTSASSRKAASSRSRSSSSGRSSKRSSGRSSAGRGSMSRNKRSRNRGQNKRKGMRTIKMTIPKDVRIEANGNRGRGKRAA